MMNHSTVLNRCLLVSVLLCCATLGAASERPGAEKRSSRAKAYVTTTWLDGNRVKLNITNRGTLNSKARNGYGGGYWPDSTVAYDNVILFDCGPWVVGKLNETPMMGLSQWGSSYSPGPAINGRAAMLANPSDSLRYRTYRINRGDNASTSLDYRDWPTDLGAPLNAQGSPRLYGEQTLWSVFNNLDSSAASGWWQSHMPNPGLPVVIHQTIYAQRVSSGDPGLVLNNVAFIEWKIVNAGVAPIESAYVSLWTDMDFGDASSNRPAVDTVHQLGYCWQAGRGFTGLPRAVGFVLLHGPAVLSTGSDAVFMGQKRSGYRNLPLSGFWGILDDSYLDLQFEGPAYSMATAWNIARGFDKLGNLVVDSATHEVTRFPYGGDPVTGTGWIATRSSGGAGFNMFTGPFTLAPGDSQWVMFALVAVNDSTSSLAIARLRQAAATLRTMSYEDIVLTGMDENGTELPRGIGLEQNFPNPFNPNTDIRYQISEVGTVRLAVSDLLGREVAVLVNERKGAGTYLVRFDATGLPSGVYFYRLRVGSYSETKRMLLIR